jgi:(S)-3,5-dihydroxyphenylglycine transaminase
VRLTDLHGSLSDPLLDAMNLLNEVTARFPDAISFAPDRPYDEPFDPSVVAGYLDAYAKYLERDRGLSQPQVGGLLFQYGRTKDVLLVASPCFSRGHIDKLDLIETVRYGADYVRKALSVP